MFDDLIARLEESLASSRELDIEICVALGKSRLDAGFQSAPYYTLSIDDALKLVPDGWTWQVSNRAPKPNFGRAYVHNGELINVGGGLTPNPKYRGSEIIAATPAIALCIAALKSRQPLSRLSPSEPRL